MGIIGIFTVEKVKLYSAQHPEMWWIALVIMLVSIISLACCEGVRRKTPHNFIFLGLFTLAEGFMLGAVTSTYRADEVLMAVLMCFIIFGFIALLFPASRTLNLVYASIGCIIFSLYIIYDTQLMVGGSHKYSLSPEEYVFAALNLYLDIINLFMYILQIIGNSRN